MARRRITPHFTWAEFACHDGTPVPRHARKDVAHLCSTLLEPLRERFGPVFVASGYRTRRYNREVGGAPDSWHVIRAGRPGAAADVWCAHGTVGEWAHHLDSLQAGGVGVYDSHVHADTRPGHARWFG
jgi:uncharacterized protein YcbK (DUF882 family)